MSNYTKTTDFAAKDTLPGGDTNKVVRGSEFETEFDAISTAIATKSDIESPTFTGTVTVPTADINGGNIDGTTVGGSTAAAGSFTTLSASSTFTLGGVAITSTAAELNILDGVTSTAAELNILDGVTATTAELNTLDGVTATFGEINLLDGSIAGTIVNSKSVVYGASGEVNATTLQIGGVSITSTAAELNILDGVTATTAELNILDGVTATTAELNILDGVTSTASELNVLDGVTAFLDEDDMTSNSATALASQQSIKAYVDSQSGGSGISNVVEDTTPQLGGSLDVNGQDIVSVSNGNITLTPNGTGLIRLDGNVDIQTGEIVLKNGGTASNIKFYCESSNAHYTQLQSAAHSEYSGNVTLTLPPSTDTLVGKATTDTLTNKTLTSPKINEDVAVSATATEINILDGVTATTAELNYLDITTLGTTEASKAVTADANAKVKFIGTTSVAEMIEKVDIPTSTTGTINFDFLSQAVQLYNTDQTANRTINFRGDSSNSLNSIMAVGESMTAAVLMKQGGTAYYLNTYQVDGSSVTPEWFGGSAPTAGNTNSIDSYVFTIIKTADATFTVLASQSQYA